MAVRTVLAPGSRPAGAAIWNPALETATPAEVEALESRRLRRQLAYTAAASAMYARMWAAAGVDARRIRTLRELRELPFTEKRDLQEALDGSAPFGANQAAPLDRLVRMQATGGTTSRPMRMAVTRRDAAVYGELGARSHWAAGVRPGDILLECMNYALYAGGVNDHMTFETLGACVAPVGVGQTRRLLSILEDLGAPAILYSTPSYALHLAEAARAAGTDPADLGIGRGVFSGDAGLENPAIRAEIEAAFGMVARNVYGTSETAPIASECDAADGLHFLGAGLVHAELIESDSGAPVPFEDDAVGELVLTTLDREAHPLIRMRTRDHVRVRVRPCACGRTGFRFQVLGRADDMFIVRGINVYPAAVGAVLAEFRSQVSGEFRVVLDAPPPVMDPPRVEVELATDLDPAARSRLHDRLTARIHELLVFTPDLVLLEPGSMPRSEMKTRRLHRAYLEAAP